MTEVEELTRQLAAERERADYAWRNTRTIEAARQEEMRKRDAAEAEIARLRMLLRRGMRQLEAWQEKYGAWQPQWLPPASDIRFAEDVSEALATPNAPHEGPARASCAGPLDAVVGGLRDGDFDVE